MRCIYNLLSSYCSSLLPATVIQLFSESLPPQTLCSCLVISSTSAVSGAANSNKSAPTRFAATTHSRKDGIAVLPITCANAPNPLLGCRPNPLWNGISTCRQATMVKQLFLLEMKIGGFSKLQNRSVDTYRYKGYSLPLVSLNSIEIYGKEVFSRGLTCRLRNVW